MTDADEQSSTTAPRRYSHPPSSRGTWTIVAIFLLGGAVLVGLFLAPRTRPPPAPPGQVDGFPEGPLKILVVDGALAGGTPGALIAAGLAVEPAPDVLMLFNVDAAVVPPLAEAFRMQSSFHPQLYQRVKPEPGSRDSFGVCVLARFPLYATVPAGAADGRRVGVHTVTNVDGRAFRISCIDIRAQAPLTPPSNPAAGVVITRHGQGDVSATLTLPVAASSGSPATLAATTRSTTTASNWVIEEERRPSETQPSDARRRPARLFILKMVQRPQTPG